MSTPEIHRPSDPGRRKFVRHCIMGSCAAVLGGYTVWDLLVKGGDAGLRIGFHHDAPDRLWKWSREADWYEVGANRVVHCKLCPHECLLSEGDRGFCRVRVVSNRKLHTVAYGNPCAMHVDPIEKKPLFHFLPGTPILSLATAGCNFRCRNCQNWEISQSKPEETSNTDLMPEALVSATVDHHIPSIAYTYSEPMIFFEYVKDSSAIARRKRIRNVLVTNGYILEDPLRELCQVTDAANVDIKCFSERMYKKLTDGTLKPVLRTLELMKQLGVWIEVTRLVVPQFSDDMDDVKRMCDWMVSAVGPDVPLHFSRFHPAYKLVYLQPTSAELLFKAREIAERAGQRYVYIGNLPGVKGEDTICPKCRRAVISREGFTITKNHLQNGHCPCGEPIPGVWS